MKRFPFDILFTLLLGLGLGLAYSWAISPLRVVDADPTALRADFKDAYRSAIASSYAATGNLPRAEARLSLLGDANSLDTLNSQAQRLIASGEFAQADLIVALAIALEDGTDLVTAPTSTTDNTTVVVKDAQTVVIGGLISDDATRQRESVPYLDSIPVLGNFFRADDARSSKINLLIFLTPHIVRDDTEIAKRSVQERDRFRGFLQENNAPRRWQQQLDRPSFAPPADKEAGGVLLPATGEGNP
jgi:hypothetical protein